MSLLRALFCLAGVCLLLAPTSGSAMVSASELPPVGDCGLPSDGHVAHAITYTLTSDCPTDGDLHVTQGAEVTIISNGFCFKIRIENGQVTVVHEDGSSSSHTSGTLSTCSSESGSSLPANCFQRLGAIGILCRVPGPGATIEVWGISSDSTGTRLLRVVEWQVDAARPAGPVASTPDGRVLVRVGHDEHIIFSMGPSPEGKIHHVILEFTLNGRVIGTHDTFGAPPAAPVAAAVGTAGKKAPAISSIPWSPVIMKQPAREDGSLVHVVYQGETLFSIARAYGVPLQALIERNRLEFGGARIYRGQALVIYEASRAVTGEPDEDEGCETDTYLAQEGDTLYAIGQALDIHPRFIAIRNQVPLGWQALGAGQALVIPDLNAPSSDCALAGRTRHVVQDGHTLFSIAIVYGVDPGELVQLNQLADCGNRIYAGQHLLIRPATD